MDLFFQPLLNVELVQQNQLIQLISNKDIKECFETNS